ncbi:MAG TPA: IPT/TIG domain-containing protein [Bryobacteraceae bacterium]|nr:IPT/TIG domain-containing protein [Bryobacteraceae bacterium]
MNLLRRRPLTLCAGILLACVSPCAAYYHYAHYLNSSSPYSVIFEKFDLTALPDKTVTFFVSDNGPTSYTPNDSFPSLLAQIRNATQVWNSVATSDLRVAFGGLQVAGTPQSVPTGEVVFEELQPGVLAYAGISVPDNVPAGSQFVPITESLIHLNINLTQQPGPAYSDSFTGPSYSESLFTTLVHEIGHALGLQHTYTASAMSTAVSRATNRAWPLDADDIASISLLYPRGGFPTGYGAINGQVTMNGNGVHLASVVALMPNGSAVSSLTLPDGTYEIDGLPPGNYLVYVHPLPPTANIIWPLDPNNNQIPADGPFISTFYPGTWEPSQFTITRVKQGATVSNINFSVRSRSAVEAYDVTSYWYGTAYNNPAYLNANAAVQTVVAQGNAIANPDGSTLVQDAWALGAPGGALEDYAQQVYQDVNVSLLSMDFDYTTTPDLGPEHLLFMLPDDIFVLPRGIQIVENPPPTVTSVTPNADGSVTVTGTNMSTASQIFFDSLPGQVTVPYASGSVSVLPPPGANGQTATVTVYNPDGQNSMLLQSQSPLTYLYPRTSAPAASISISALPQGVSAMVKVTSSNMQFMDGLTTLGFGSGDVTVRRLWVISSTEAWADVTVSPTALLRGTVASVISGFQVYEQGLGFQVMPANPSLPTISLPVPNAFYPVQNSLYPGAIASMYGQNLVASGGTATLTINNQSAQILYASATQINFVIPAGLPIGPAVLTLRNGSVRAYPVAVQIDPPPPVIVSATSASGSPLGAGQSATAGDTITLALTSLDPAVVAAPGRVTLAEAGASIPEFTISQAQDGSGDLFITFALAASVTGQQVPVTVALDGDLSMPFYISVAPQQ